MTIAALSFIHRFEPATTREGRRCSCRMGPAAMRTTCCRLAHDRARFGAAFRGKILEGGMPRFFRRLAEGVFDEADVRHRANELADFNRSS